MRRLTTEHLLFAGTLAAAGLSVISPWWVLPMMAGAFLAGRRPGPTWSTAVGLSAVLAAGVVAISLVPSWISWAGRCVAVVAGAVMPPWSLGRFAHITAPPAGPRQRQRAHQSTAEAVSRIRFHGHRP
ncbi:hypothetical protein [Streptomyces sp. NPDC005322]|uniref:hypothetical protein n=1 Tax=Streptomyces sp. NPDC005322 TaxID=3157032 RepID=UPI0033A47A1A